MVAEPIASPLNPSPRESARIDTFFPTKVCVLFLITTDGDSYRLTLCTVLMEQHNFRGACDEFRQELRLNPDLPGALALLSSCERHLQAGQ